MVSTETLLSDGGPSFSMSTASKQDQAKKDEKNEGIDTDHASVCHLMNDHQQY